MQRLRSCKSAFTLGTLLAGLRALVALLLGSFLFASTGTAKPSTTTGGASWQTRKFIMCISILAGIPTTPTPRPLTSMGSRQPGE